jgi:hypothetical protein
MMFPTLCQLFSQIALGAFPHNNTFSNMPLPFWFLRGNELGFCCCCCCFCCCFWCWISCRVADPEFALVFAVLMNCCCLLEWRGCGTAWNWDGDFCRCRRATELYGLGRVQPLLLFWVLTTYMGCCCCCWGWGRLDWPCPWPCCWACIAAWTLSYS